MPAIPTTSISIPTTMAETLNAVLTPLHLLSFSTLLGTQLYQTFIVTKAAHTALPRSSFTTLQKRLFPLYFRSQSLLLLLAAVTIPWSTSQSSSSWPTPGLVTRKGAWIPFAIAGVTAALNLSVFGPRTRSVMIERIHQETRDARKPLLERDRDLDTIGSEMQALNRSFARNHAMSIHLNLLSIGAMLWWGWQLSSRLDL
ncbi:hypothetical protein F5Y16DRAFT_379890 [Xylariaceae sp. FL0255]|nr:hypothetical protein F5Y16DRAFT_379890 [Xylariaceae sp. FL0255]